MMQNTLSPRISSLLSLILSIGLGILDYVTGDLSLLIFYLVPITIATWHSGRAASILISSLCALELLATALLLHPPGNGILSLHSWNFLIESTFLLITAYILNLLKEELERNRSRAKELEAANMELDAFNHSVAHDLRRPLTVINGYSQMIIEECGGLDDECLGYVREILEGSTRMDELMQSLLDFSSAGHLALERSEVDLSEMAREIARDLQLAKPRRRVKYYIAEGMRVDGDPKLLHLAMENLMANAWKYTGNVDAPEITVGITESEGRQTFFVRDNGIGFQMAEAAKLFTPFVRLPGADRFSGHGIGLSTVRRIIERHGGTIWAQSEPGNGCTFYFRI